jgi:hypothetical protein
VTSAQSHIDAQAAWTKWLAREKKLAKLRQESVYGKLKSKGKDCNILQLTENSKSTKLNQEFVKLGSESDHLKPFPFGSFKHPLPHTLFGRHVYISKNAEWMASSFRKNQGLAAKAGKTGRGSAPLYLYYYRNAACPKTKHCKGRWVIGGTPGTSWGSKVLL